MIIILSLKSVILVYIPHVIVYLDKLLKTKLTFNIYLKQNKSPLSKSLFNLHLGAIVSTVLYNISLITTNLLSAYFITSLYYISIHFLVILLTDFIFIFTEMSSSPKYKKFIKVFNKIWLYVFFVDSFILILNPFFHHEFELSRLYINHNVFLCWNAKYFWMFNLIWNMEAPAL